MSDGHLTCPFCFPVDARFEGVDPFIDHVLSTHGTARPRHAWNAIREVHRRGLRRRDSGIDLTEDENLPSLNDSDAQTQDIDGAYANLLPRLARVKEMAARYLSNSALRSRTLYQNSLNRASSVSPPPRPPLPEVRDAPRPRTGYNASQHLRSSLRRYVDEYATNIDTERARVRDVVDESRIQSSVEIFNETREQVRRTMMGRNRRVSSSASRFAVSLRRSRIPQVRDEDDRLHMNDL